ncbi:MAG: two-component sensor histidine kinase [Bacteroidaceae bacterium]|nr:two-component sensor histidine kinase [Bacteroidaceae bacterium]
METQNQELATLRQQLKQQEKLASLGMLSAGIAHEIQNPLNFVINFSKMSNKLLKDLKEIVADNEDKIDVADREDLEEIMSDLNENLEKIVEHGERAISIIQGILLVSRGKEDEFIPSDICHIVKEYVWLSYHAMRANNKNFNISIHEEYQSDIPLIMVIPQGISRAVLNVANNACYSVFKKSEEMGGDYTPALNVKVTYDGHEVRIMIKDNGVGMNEEVKRRIYENFFSTKPVGKGTGLGMGITRDIIEKHHHGRIEMDTKEGEYACFTFIIPAKLK